MTPTTDTTGKSLESLIVALRTANGWLPGEPYDHQREYAVALTQLTFFLEDAHPAWVDAFDLMNASPTRHKFLSRLQGEVTKCGGVDVLRKGVGHGALAHRSDLRFRYVPFCRDGLDLSTGLEPRAFTDPAGAEWYPAGSVLSMSEGTAYPSVEHAHQDCKTLDLTAPQLRERHRRRRQASGEERDAARRLP